MLEGSTPDNKTVKHTYLELFGTEKEFTEVKNWKKKEVRRLPGLVWSPTLLALMRKLGPSLIGSVPDTGRVVEHNMPGYEMHVEHPTVGSRFVYLNLLSDTVLQFDDESTGREGHVYLPSRSLMCVSDEARWGFRFGERSEDCHTFKTKHGVRRQIDTDLRLSVQLWKLSPGLLDSRFLQERLEESIAMVGKGLSKEAAKAREKEREEQEAHEALLPFKDTMYAIDPAVASDPLRGFLSSAFEKKKATGLLGGDLESDGEDKPVRSSAKKSIGDVKEDYEKYKDQFTSIQGILQDMKSMQDAGQPINDLWLQKKIREKSNADPEMDAEAGFDPSNVEGTWDKVDAKARFYKEKLKKMDYDGTAFLNSRMPDISQDAPLDMRTTITKIAPHVKDGDKILASLPQSPS
ncbi:hypothetical protein STCU_03330 [Strigomonas culicis]|nr:hypothetical protein STCU_03330 [Strigomonas culicis]|eukprot:EPY31688.1 hypothetical protein STCU_03330 [Strigomonas culicis]